MKRRGWAFSFFQLFVGEQNMNGHVLGCWPDSAGLDSSAVWWPAVQSDGPRPPRLAARRASGSLRPPGASASGAGRQAAHSHIAAKRGMVKWRGCGERSGVRLGGRWGSAWRAGGGEAPTARVSAKLGPPTGARRPHFCPGRAGVGSQMLRLVVDRVSLSVGFRVAKF